MDDALFSIARNQLNIGQEREILNLRLSQKQPIKRIIVLFDCIGPGQSLYGEDMLVNEAKGYISCPLASRGKVFFIKGNAARRLACLRIISQTDTTL